METWMKLTNNNNNAMENEFRNGYDVVIMY